MKLTASALSIIMLVQFASAQTPVKYTIDLDSSYLPKKIRIPFSTVRVIDARIDKSTIGAVVSDLSFKGMTKNKMQAVFPDSLPNYLPSIMKNIVTLDKTNTDTLIMLIKQFRVADRLLNTVEKYHVPESIMTFSCSFYKKEGNFIRKIFSVNDKWACLWNTTAEPEKNELPTYRNDALLQLLAKPFENKNWATSSQTFSLSEVEEGLQKRNQMPLFMKTGLVQGVYKNFEEFKNNRPSIEEYKIEKISNEIQELSDINSSLIPQENIWGLCDGKDSYINFLGKYYKLLKEDKTYYFLFNRQESEPLIEAGRNVQVQTGGNYPLTFSPVEVINIFRKNVREERLYLNLETGEVHVEEIIGTARLPKIKH